MSMQTKARNVSLTPEIDAFIVGRIASGRLRSASEVVRAVWRLLEGGEREGNAPGRWSQAEGRQIER